MSITRFLTRPLSYSQLASWEYNKEEWYRNYILGKRSPASAEMLAGTTIGDQIGTETCPLGLANIGIKEYALLGMVDDIKLVGYIDIYNPETKHLHENKTSPNVKRWNQRKADEHGQLTMYALLLEQQEGTPPEQIAMYLNFVPLRLAGVTYTTYTPIVWKQYETRRTSEQVAAYKDYIRQTVKAMQEYITTVDKIPRPPAFRSV